MSIYQYELLNINNKNISLKDYEGQYLLLVNVASECGLTPQYKGLQALFDRFKNRSFVVLGIPCNQFGKQEPGTLEEIQSFCARNFQVSFPLFSKIEVNGENVHPLYQYLKNTVPNSKGESDISWNFTKFLVGPDGIPLKRYDPDTEPSAIEKEIETLL